MRWRIAGEWVLDYLRAILLFGMFFYFVTAARDGSFRMQWNWMNILLVLSYLVAYPLFMLRHPSIRHWLRLEAYSTRAIRRNMRDDQSEAGHFHEATNPINNRYNLEFSNANRDDILNLCVSFVVCGLVMLLAIPLLIGDWGLTVVRKNKKGSHQ